MNLDAVIAELEYFQEGVFPRKALQEAIAHPKEITPLLLQALEDAKNNIQRLVDDPDYMLHVYAFYLLAQFQEPRAYQLIIDFFAIPGDNPMDVTGDFATEDLGRILASVCGRNLDPIKRLIETPILRDSIRGGGLNAFTTLLVEEKLTREEILDYFQHLFLTTDRTSEDLWPLLVMNSIEICPNDVIRESVQAAFDDGLVPSFWISPKDVEYYQNLGVKGCLEELQEKSHYRFVRDTIAEIGWWACFREKEIDEPKPKLSLQEVMALTQPKRNQNYSQQTKNKKKSKSKKSPLKEAKGFAATPKKKTSSKKNRSKK